MKILWDILLLAVGGAAGSVLRGWLAEQAKRTIVSAMVYSGLYLTEQ